MSKNRYDDYHDGYDSFDKPDIMDRIGDSFSSVFSRRSRENEKADEAYYEFSKKGRDDFFVDERVERRKTQKKPQQASSKKKGKSKSKSKVKKPVTPLVRKIRNIITYCIIVGVILVVCVVLSLTVLFKTQNYEVSGNTKYDQNEIISTCGITKSENIFLANKRSAEKKLLKTYPYMEDVDVSFAIPDTITINITEAVPAYIVKVTDSQFLIVSSKGRVLEHAQSIEGYNIPLFLGSNVTGTAVGDFVSFDNENTLKIINEIVTVFVDNGYTGITELDATDPANITFTYDGRIKVKLGFPEDISYKIRTAMTIIIEKLDLNGTNTTEGELDVSNCNTTKKSYFREQSLIDAEIPTQSENDETPTESEYIDEDADGYDDITGEIIEYEEEPTEEPTEALSPDDWYL